MAAPGRSLGVDGGFGSSHPRSEPGQQRMHHRSLLLFAFLVLSGCDGTSEPLDASVPDAGPALEPSRLFGPCVEDWQCPGEGAICRTAADGYPGGYCTVPCEDRTPCRADDIYHHCVVRDGEERAYCEQRCLNGIDCGRDAYTCAGELPPSGGLCIAVCSDDEQCGSGTRCDPYSGECVAGEPSTEGGVTGDPCFDDSDCRSGRCVTEVGEGRVPTGWIGGYCVSNCILPSGFNNNTFYSGESLPQATCVGDAVCLPSQGQSRGDLGTCYDQCTSDDDCREGYGCLRTIQLANGHTSHYSNGACVPKGCNAHTDCPSGYQCVTVQGSDGQPRNVCAR